MIRLILVLFAISMATASYAQELLAFKLFDSKGAPISYADVQQQLFRADVVCFGESHDNALAHWLELALFEALIQEKGSQNLIFGAEMLETDQQPGLDSLQDGTVTMAQFEAKYKMWRNFGTDYLPLLEVCLAQDIPIIATNCPTRLARQTGRQGIHTLDSLPDTEKQWLPPLPIQINYDLASYVAMRDMLGSHHSETQMADYLIEAQALRDATMAHRILTSHEKGKVFYHLNGSYHTQNREGIIWFLAEAKPRWKVLTISIVEQESIDQLETEHTGQADILIAIPDNMTRTYVNPFR